jgi:hypothetical protein
MQVFPQKHESLVPALDPFPRLDAIEAVPSRRIRKFTIPVQSSSLLSRGNHRVTKIPILDNENIVVIACRMHQ